MTDTKARRLSVVRTSSDALRLDLGETVHIGVDVHKATYHVALLSDRRGLVATWVQPARPELLAERLTPLREAIAQVVYEAGPTGFALVRRLRADGFRAEVIAPAKTPVTPGA
jgi:transposase